MISRKPRATTSAEGTPLEPGAGTGAASRPSSPIHYLDAMRSVLMMLGVVYHSAMLYSATDNWIITSPRALPAFGVLADVLTSFRIQAFFIVAGFFCLYTVQKYGPVNFISLRGPRIAVPLIVTALTLNYLQELLLARHLGFAPSFDHFFTSRTWISHLWFLLALLYFFLTVFVLALVLPARATDLLKRGAAKVARMPVPILLLLMSGYAVAVLGAGRLFPVYDRPLHLISYHTYLYYLSFFAFGLLLRQHADLLERFTSQPWMLSLGVLAILYLLPVPPGDDALTLLEKAPRVFRDALTTWLFCSLCFHVFKRFCDRPSALFTYLSDASYTVYLFHHLLVIGIGIQLIALDWHSVPGFATLVGTTLMACLAIHHFLIRRAPPLRFLYNGRARVIDRLFRDRPAEPRPSASRFDAAGA